VLSLLPLLFFLQNSGLKAPLLTKELTYLWEGSMPIALSGIIDGGSLTFKNL